MSLDINELLSDDNKRKILSERINQFAAEIYQYELNKKTAEATEMQNHIDAADKAIAILTKAIEIHKAELETIPSSES